MNSPTPTSKLPPLRRPQWHRIYFVLAAFDVLTVCLGLFLTHRIMRAYEHSVNVNQAWTMRRNAYEQLGELAQAVNAPSNDVFDTHDVQAESERMRVALARFNQRLAELRLELQTNSVPDEVETPLRARLDDVQTSMMAMVEEANLIFHRLELSQPEQAGRRMATMDRKYAPVNRAIADLRNEVSKVQKQLFDEQIARADSLQKFEILIAALILFMVGAATLYGRALARRAQATEQVRDGFDDYLARINKDGFADGIMLVQTSTGERRLWEYHNTLRIEGVAAPIARGMARDITDGKRAEAALRESEERYRTLFETSPDGIAVFDAEMKIVMTNRQTAEMFGYDNSAEVIGLSGYDLIPPQNRPRARESARKGIETGRMLPIESIGVKKDGTQFAVELSAALIPSSEGKPLAILGVGRDITERKLADEQLKASHEQLRALSARLLAAREEEGTRIAREIHHELGGVLTALKWDLEGIEKILSGAGNGGRIETVREKIPNMTGLIESTINTVRRISSELRPGVLDDLGLAAAIEWQARQFQSRTGIQCECAAGTDFVVLSRERATAVFRIFQEILTNVIRHAQATRVEIDLAERDGYLELRVKDDGRGITEDEKRDARSLGLVGMRERALLVGGELSVAGMAGLGTTVIARVPLEA